jgi:hypothetical protein
MPVVALYLPPQSFLSLNNGHCTLLWILIHTLTSVPPLVSAPFSASASSSGECTLFSKFAFLCKCTLLCNYSLLQQVRLPQQVFPPMYLSLSLEGGSIGMKAPYPRQNHQRKKGKQERFVSHPYLIFNTNRFFGFLNICCIKHTLLRVLSLWWIYIYINISTS